MKIGVMMTAYNAAPFIRFALQSILRQRSDDIAFDIVVVNDGSTDETGQIVRALDAPEIRLIETPNQGVTRARNVALDNMAEDIDLFTSLDADDLSPQGRFARDMRHFVEDPKLDFVYGYALLFRDVSDDGLAPEHGARTQRVRGITIGSGLFRAALVRQIGNFDPVLGQSEDTDWLLRIFERELNFRLLDDVGLYYRRHGDNMTSNTLAMRRHFARALMKSIHRRRLNGGSDLPQGIFDAGDLATQPPL